MSFIGCATTPEDEGANFTPPTLGEFMKREAEKARVLREARAGSQVVQEARLFHERQAQKHGLSTRRGIAHLRAARMFSREAGQSLQERLESFNSEVGQMDPKVLAKATKDTIGFHKKMAQKHGLDSDLGHAHTAAMEHHMDTLQKLKQQTPQQPPQQPQQVSGEEAAEGGPGSGPRKSGKEKQQGLSKEEAWSKAKQVFAAYPKETQARMAKFYMKHGTKESREALPGKSGKQLPVPVPNKSQIPNQDIKQNKPPIDLDAQQGGVARLQQGEEGGPGSGPRPHGGSQKKSGGIPKHNSVKAKVLQKAGFKRVKDGKMKDEGGKVVPVHRFQKGDHIIEMNSSTNQYNKGVWDHFKKGPSGGQRLIDQGSRADELHSYIKGKSLGESRTFESRLQAFHREACVQNTGLDPCLTPNMHGNTVKKMTGKDQIDTGPMPGREARRRLRRPIWESDDSERDRSESGLTA